MNDNNFVMFGNYKQYFEMLNAEQCKKLILMLFEYSETGETNQCDDLNINLVYKTITDNIIIGSKRRIASIENGKKGGRPRKDNSPKIDQPTKKQIDFCKENNIDITGKSKVQVGNIIEKYFEDKKKQGNYNEPTWDNVEVDEEEVVTLEELEAILNG